MCQSALGNQSSKRKFEAESWPEELELRSSFRSKAFIDS